MKNSLENMTSILTNIFEEVLTDKGYEIRDCQVELSKHMLEAFYKREIAICEAGVGTGKTYAYLIAAVLQNNFNINDFWIRNNYALNNTFQVQTKMPIIISTSSIALQLAIKNDYVSKISKIFIENNLIDKPLSCVIRKGKEHYMCDIRLKDYINSVDKEVAEPLLPFVNYGYKSIDLDDYDFLTPYVKRKINVKGNCNRTCHEYKNCRYRQLIKYLKLESHDFQICNHNYLLADTIMRDEEKTSLLPNYRGIIIDEAHSLLDISRQMYETKLSTTDINKLVSQIRKINYKEEILVNKIDELTSKILLMNENIFKRLVTSIVNSDDTTDDLEVFEIEISNYVFAILEKEIVYLKEIYNLIANNKINPVRFNYLYKSIFINISNVISSIEIMLNENENMYWLEIPKISMDNTNEKILKSIPNNINEILHNQLWKKRIPIILTSATLSVAGDFSTIKKSLGLDLVQNENLSEISTSSPFDYKNNCLLYISEQVEYPQNKEARYLKSVALEVLRLIKATHGHTLILFTSYRVLRYVYKFIQEKNIEYPLIKLDKSNSTALEMFRNSGNGVLFASGGLWEGIDIAGDILSSLIIVKMPFGVPSVISKQEEKMYSDKLDYRNEIILPHMILKLKQGFGRLIRNEKDTGVVAILDSRVNEKGSCRRIVLESLPNCRVTSKIIDVERFIRRKKDENYFK